MQISSSFLRAPYWGFVAFGTFWGVWGASVPRIREQAGISDAELGIALLFVGAGALPAMLLAGRALDRWGLWLTGPLLLALGLSGVLVALTASGGFIALCIGLAIVGAASGASDVALNSLAGRVEVGAGRPVITPAHATFSAVVVVGILGAGGLGALGIAPILPFVAVAAVSLVVCVAVIRSTRANDFAVEPVAASTPGTKVGISLAFLLGVGYLGALAFASENAHQSWSAVFLEDELSAPTGLSAFGPAVFAAVVSITRFAVTRVDPKHARILLIVGALTATTGTLGVAFSTSLPIALVSLAVGAAGTAVLFPTLLGVVSRAVDEERRARATSTLTVVAYAGFLAGPAYVGLIAEIAGLRGAMVAVAALTALMAVLVPVIIRGRHLSPRASSVDAG